MKKILLTLVALCVTTTVFAEVSLSTQVRMSTYWAMHSDRDFSYKFDDNDGGNSGIKIKAVNGPASLNLELVSSSNYNTDGGTTDVAFGQVYLETEIWKDVLAAEMDALNDPFSFKLNGGVNSYSVKNDYDVAPMVSYGGDGISQESVGTETGLALGADLAFMKNALGTFTLRYGMLVDTGVDGFQQTLGGRDDTSDSDTRAIGVQAPQVFASLGYDFLGKRSSYGPKDFQLFGEVGYSSVGGVSTTVKDFIPDAGSGSVRTGGHTVGVALRGNIPVDLVQDDPYTHFEFGASAAYFTGSSFTAEDLVMSDWDDAASSYYGAELSFNPYTTYGADMAWYMPFSEKLVMDVGVGVRGRTSLTYDYKSKDVDLEEIDILQKNQNLDFGSSVMFSTPVVLDGGMLGFVVNLDNMMNGQSLPNIDGSAIKGFQNQDPNLTVALGGGVEQAVGRGKFTYKVQGGVTNLLSNDLYVSTSTDPSFVSPELLGAFGVDYTFDGTTIDLGVVYTPFGGLETSLLDIKTGRGTMDPGKKVGVYLNFISRF